MNDCSTVLAERNWKNYRGAKAPVCGLASKISIKHGPYSGWFRTEKTMDNKKLTGGRGRLRSQMQCWSILDCSVRDVTP